ncbi:SLC2A4 regulator isoform X2 [Lemur catta]|uniref:SLC2A4 regulator isoform X2 n=2 Tax=Lemur catta TaxID=9447 RepID=UPI001E26C5BA|nr:SLC2A4 regulator isoform X2 [Lemur catta]
MIEILRPLIPPPPALGGQSTELGGNVSFCAVSRPGVDCPGIPAAPHLHLLLPRAPTWGWLRGARGGLWPASLGPRTAWSPGSSWLLATGAAPTLPRPGPGPTAAVAQPWLMCDGGRTGPGLAPNSSGLQTPAQHRGLKEPQWNKAQGVENSGCSGTPVPFLVVPGDFQFCNPSWGRSQASSPGPRARQPGVHTRAWACTCTQAREGPRALAGPTRTCPVSSRATVAAARLEEVMAAAALTSLSTSPLLLGAPVAAFSPEPGLEPWKEALVQPPGSYSSSSASGEWGWDLASDQSSPSTPSPPLPPEAAHFLFGEPTLRKRKSSAQVVFQCLWKSCGKVLSTASGMQRHIRLVHLGRQAEPEQSDGEEDFYYTELDAGVDTLADGLSSLTPASPTASLPPSFPRLELLELPEPPVLTSAGTPQACHGDHAYQAGEATGGSWGQLSEHSGGLEPQPTEVRPCVPALPARTGASLRKPRGDAKKCRKVYGMDHRDLWCTACRWKKACQRFLD